MKDDPESALARSFRESLLVAETEAPSFEDVSAYVDGRLTGEALALFEERLSDDPLLQAEVHDLRALREEMARPRRTGVAAWPYLAAAAALLAAVAGLLVVYAKPRTTTLSGPIARRATPDGATAGGNAPAVVAAVHDGPGSIELRTDGTLRGVPVPEELTPSIVRALRDGAVAVPPLRADLAVSRVTAMGSSSAAVARFAPVAPLSTLVRSDRPTLRWSAHPQARSYEVSVFDLDLEPVASSGAIKATEWTPAAPLRRSRTYLWQVRAVLPAGSETVPAPPEAEARFHVASAAAAGRVDAALASGSALAAGVALAEGGFLDEAAARFDGLAEANPGSPEVERLRAALAASRRR
jgi:hypothetical protein